jgi:geranylgeranyl reductase family protein
MFEASAGRSGLVIICCRVGGGWTRRDGGPNVSIEFQLPVTYDADVIVVGAGPAGAATAFHLARAGIDVLMLDAASFPRDKVCGDFVGPVALRELSDLGVTRRAALQRTNRIIGASLHLDGKHMVTRNLPVAEGLPPFGRVIPRADLDEWIVDAAVGVGVRLQTPTKVTAVRSNERCVTVEAVSGEELTTLRTRLVIAADGSNSKIAKGLRGGVAAPKKDRIVAVRAYFSDVTGPGDRCDMYFSQTSFPGYYWLFPTSATTANVGLGMVMETTPPTDGHLRTMLLDVVESDPAVRERLGGATIEGRVLGWPLSTYNHRTPLVHDGILLVGDAAGLINPLNGEGIQYALLSGRWAADTIIPALHGATTPNHAHKTTNQVATGVVSAAMLRPYERRVAKELRSEMALATTIVNLIRRRDLNPVWLEALRVICARATVDKAYADLAGGILAGITPASTALSRQILGGTAKQVGRTAIVKGARTIVAPRTQIRSMVEMVTETATTVAGNSVNDPKASMSWAGDVALSLFELATQTVGAAAQTSRSTM